MSKKNVDEYLAALPKDVRATLARLRKAITTAAPTASEVISYGIPAYKHRGMLVSFGAAKQHCAFYVMSESAMKAHKDDLSPYDTAKGTIRFPIGGSLPDGLVKKLVRTRIRENEAAKAS